MRDTGRKSNEDDDSWNENSEFATGGYTSDEDFDYDEYVDREFPKQKYAGGFTSALKSWSWRLMVVLICLLLIWKFISN